MLKLDIRRGKILDRLKQDGAVSVSNLAAELCATPVTIRSDLDALEKDGYLVRVQGGEVNAQYGFIHGNDAQEQLSHYQADWTILSLDGISASGGITTYHAEESAINRMMIAQAS